MSLLVILAALAQTVRVGGATFEVDVRTTPEGRHDALRSAPADRALLLAWPHERFPHLHTEGIDRAFDLVFLTAEGKVVETASLAARRDEGVTPSAPAALVLALPPGRAAARAGEAAELPRLERIEPPDTVGFRGKDPATCRLFVETAFTWPERARGMMHRRRLAADDGMLFKYAGEEEHRYWMKNTHVSLDIAFLRADGTIRRIHRKVKTLDDQARHGSDGPVQWALETNGGWFEAHGLAEGDAALIPERLRRLKADP